MSKFVIETVQIIRNKYYVEADNQFRACEAVSDGELDHFSSSFLTEEIINVFDVEEFPKASILEDVNAAIMVYNEEADCWDTQCGWEYK